MDPGGYGYEPSERGAGRLLEDLRTFSGSTAISVGGSRVQIVFPGWLLRGGTAERAELAAPLVSRGPGNPYRGQYPGVQVALPAQWRHPHGGPALVWSNTCSPTDRAQEPEFRPMAAKACR